MTAEEMDDHLPPPAPAGKPVREKKARAAAAPAARTSPWPDRALFLAVGLLAGFTAAYLYLDRNPSAVPPASPADPHAGLAGVGPGATRDLPGSGGGQPSLAADPVARQKLNDLEAAVAKEPKNATFSCSSGTPRTTSRTGRRRSTRTRGLSGCATPIPTFSPISAWRTGASATSTRHSRMFTQASARDPNHWPAQFNLAIVYGIDKGDTKKALEILTKLKKEHPEIPALDRLMGELERRAKGRPRA